MTGKIETIINDWCSISEGYFRKILESIDIENIRMKVFELYDVPTDYMDSNLTLRKIYF